MTVFKQTPDWTIRQAVLDDADSIMAHMRRIADERDNGTSYNSSTEYTITREELREKLQDYHDRDNSLWLVAVDSAGDLIGSMNCEGGKRARHGTLSLGITVAKDWRNRGIGSALMQTLIDWCRSNPVVHRLELEVVTTNLRAVHVYEKMGFEREGIQRRSMKKHGQFVDTFFMAMLFD